MFRCKRFFPAFSTNCPTSDRGRTAYEHHSPRCAEHNDEFLGRPSLQSGRL